VILDVESLGTDVHGSLHGLHEHDVVLMIESREMSVDKCLHSIIGISTSIGP
jgi:hypothetical protein